MSTEEQATAPLATEGSTQQEEGVKVFAGNLSYKATDDDLKAIFEPLGGDILSLQIVFRGQRSSGYGFVNYKNKEDADRAVQALHGKDVGGRELVVELAKPPQPKEKKPRAKKTPAARAPRAEDAVDGEDETTTAPAAAAATEANGEVKPKAKRTRPPRRRAGKKEAATEEGEGAAAPAVGEDGQPIAPAPKATRPPRKPKAARIDDESGEAAAPASRAPRAPRPPREAPTGEPSKTLLFVANLPFSLDDEGLKKVFTDAGVTVNTARIVKRKFGIRRSKGFGFVDTTSEEEQQKGLKVDGTEIEARAIAVKVALSSQLDPESADAAAPATTEQTEATTTA